MIFFLSSFALSDKTVDTWGSFQYIFFIESYFSFKWAQDFWDRIYYSSLITTITRLNVNIMQITSRNLSKQNLF